MTEIIKTADLVDTNDDEVRFCEMQWKSFGKRPGFHGEIVTLKTFEDNRLLKQRWRATAPARCWSSTAAGRCDARWSET